jgi:hypothetical protein
MDVAAEVARHRDYLFGVAYRMLGSRQDAEDVLQEAFVRAQRAGGGASEEPRSERRRTFGAASDREPANASAFVSENDDRSGDDVLFELAQSAEEKGGLFVGPVRRSPEEDHAGTRVSPDGEELPEVGVDRDDAPVRGPRRGHHVAVGCAEETEIAHVDGVVARRGKRLGDAGGERLVDEEVHPAGRRGISRSSTAAAAYRRASWMSSAVSWGNSATISSVVMPSATMPTTVATGMRVPRTQGTPPIIR